MFRLLGSCLKWVLGWAYFVCVICFIGAMLGVLTHVLFAFFVVDQPDYGFYAAFGFMNGLKYAGVWSGGAAIVLCVIRARKEYLGQEADGTEGAGSE